MMKDSVLLAAVTKVIQPHKQLLVAFSGGVDSTVLLDILQRLRVELSLTIRAVYIHHGLSENADSWAEHCRKVCLNWHIPFLIKQVTVDERVGGIESAARQVRYQALAEELKKQEILLTAQHLDDQCETFLLALKRGSGPAGLAAMPVKISFQQTELIRPLLGISRQSIEEYAQYRQLSWVEDESNQQDRFDRNFLRLQVVPVMQQRWPGFVAAVARSARLCAEQELLLDELLIPILQSLLTAEGGLPIEPLMEMSVVKRQALIRRWIAYHRQPMLSYEQLKHLWSDIVLARQDAEPKLQLANYQIRRFKQILFILPCFQDIHSLILPWERGQVLLLPDNLGCLYVSTDNMAQSITVRAPLPEEQITVGFSVQGKLLPAQRHHSRSIKKLWQEYGIAPWLRQRTPLLFYNQTLIAALGIFVTRDGLATEVQQAWHINWDKR